DRKMGCREQQHNENFRHLLVQHAIYPFYKIGQSIGQAVARVIGSAKEERTFRAAPPAQDAAVGVVLSPPAPAAQIGVVVTH
ncbi:MAG TPA: hypothetical protein VEY94_05845, partial [Patescibacteria group bacterium]|nr:hypothetical protein [Patescibacteria group bacterium]